MTASRTASRELASVACDPTADVRAFRHAFGALNCDAYRRSNIGVVVGRDTLHGGVPMSLPGGPYQSVVLEEVAR
jgi:hypothetical protein